MQGARKETSDVNNKERKDNRMAVIVIVEILILDIKLDEAVQLII